MIVVVAVVAVVAILGTIYYLKAKHPSKKAPTTPSAATKSAAVEAC